MYVAGAVARPKSNDKRWLFRWRELEFDCSSEYLSHVLVQLEAQTERDGALAADQIDGNVTFFPC